MSWAEISAPYSRYEVSKDGKVRRRTKDGFKELRPGFDNTGYKRVLLYPSGKGKRKSIRVHQLVAKHFVPGSDTGHHIRFRDGKKTNIRADNLEWVPADGVGVELDKETGRWRASVYKNRRKIFKGYHSTKADAQKARKDAQKDTPK